MSKNSDTNNKSVELDSSEAVIRVKKATYRTFFKVLFIFGTSSIFAAFLGDYIDDYFGISPWVKFSLLGVMYILSWIYLIKFNKDIKKIIK